MARKPKKEIEPKYDFLNSKLAVGDTVVAKVKGSGTSSNLYTGKITGFTPAKVRVRYINTNGYGGKSYDSDTIKYGRDLVKINSYQVPATTKTLMEIQSQINERIFDLIDTDEEIKNLRESFDALKIITDGK